MSALNVLECVCVVCGGPLSQVCVGCGKFGWEYISMGLTFFMRYRTMAKVEIYTSPFCGFCHAAKRLLDSKCVEYVEFDVLLKPSLRKEMQGRSNDRCTVPQIFIDGSGIGGCDELHQLEASGELNTLLGRG